MDLIFSRDHVWFQLDLFSRPNCPKGPGGRGRHFIDVVVVVIVVVAYVQSSIQFGRPFWQSMFDIANGKPFHSQPSWKVGNDVLF